MNDTFDLWAILELMGHVKLAGRVTEEERFGSKMGRIDVPDCIPCDCKGADQIHGNDRFDCPKCKGSGFLEKFTTHYFGGGSIYRLTPTSEEVARAVAANHKPQPISPWELPRALTHQAVGRPEANDEYRHDDGE